jgi:hypothetical protein
VERLLVIVERLLVIVERLLVIMERLLIFMERLLISTHILVTHRRSQEKNCYNFFWLHKIF